VADRNEYEARLLELFGKGMRGTMARVFAQYVAEFSEPDRKFDTLYLEGLFATRTPPQPLRRRDRFRRLLQEFAPTLRLCGLVAECGCAGGLSSFLLCSRLKQQDPRFDGGGYEIYDSFQGLSEPRAEDEPEPGGDRLAAQSLLAGKFAFPLEYVQNSLAAFPRIRYGPGWIPAAFPKDGGRYRFVHVDVDLYQPTKASLEYFWPLLVPGGVMVCDDYNWSGAKRAVAEFAAQAGVKFSATP
jgi:O-methyltransferase